MSPFDFSAENCLGTTRRSKRGYKVVTDADAVIAKRKSTADKVLQPGCRRPRDRNQRSLGRRTTVAAPTAAAATFTQTAVTVA